MSNDDKKAVLKNKLPKLQSTVRPFMENMNCSPDYKSKLLLAGIPADDDIVIEKVVRDKTVSGENVKPGAELSPSTPASSLPIKTDVVGLGVIILPYKQPSIRGCGDRPRCREGAARFYRGSGAPTGSLRSRGKTKLLKRLVLRDVGQGHGVLDPHNDAIDELIKRIPQERLPDVISLNPEHETHAFGINLLAYSNIHSWTERENTYNRAKAVFDKLWKNMPEELPWLQLIIEHTLPVFIKNHEYTLSEVPRFLSNAEFRTYLLRNVKYDTDVGTAFFVENLLKLMDGIRSTYGYAS